MSDRRLRIVICVLAAVGVAVAGYLTYARFTHTSIACTTGGCETVQSSRYAEVAGIPVALLGLAAYAAILATAFSASELARAAAAAIALGSAAFSAYLLYVQFALIEALCQWCLVSDTVIGLLAIATVVRLAAGHYGKTANAIGPRTDDSEAWTGERSSRHVRTSGR
jgi:uncharacterized membrane protein